MLGVECTVGEWRPRHVYKDETKTLDAEARWERTFDVILEALRPFMEAREAVARALAEFEKREAPGGSSGES